MDAQKFCLKWDGFPVSVTSVFDSLRQDSELVDVTLCCDGQRVRAHRMMLSACSPYFRELFKDLSSQQLVIFLKDTSSADLTAIVEFMYKGCVNVTQNQLASFIKTAELLQVQGLSGGEDKEPPPSPAPPPPPPAAPPRAWSRPPASPAAGARRAPDLAVPGEPRAKRRRAEPEPPPPPPPVVGGGTEGAVHQPAQPEQFASPVKVEKFDVDLTLEDEDSRPAGDEFDGAGDGLDGAGDELDAALGHVAQYEGFDPGPDQSLSADGQMFGAAGGDGTLPGNASDPGGPYTPGPSQRTGEDGGQGLPPYECDICGRRYWVSTSLRDHKKIHEGRTQCRICGRVSGRVPDLRIHLRDVHKLTMDEIRAMVPIGEKCKLVAPAQMRGDWQTKGPWSEGCLGWT